MTQYTFRGNSPQPIVGTQRNQERTGKRTVTRLSAIARKVEGIRAIDIDLVPYCPRCGDPLAFCEVKPYEVHDAEWRQIRRHADFWGCLALLVIEKENDIGVKIYNSFSGLTTPVFYGGEKHLLSVLCDARDIHVCRKQ